MRRPWFPFYQDDFQGSGRVRLMSNAERGCYVTLLAFQWRDGWVPSEIVELARLCGEPPATMKKYWRRLESCFPVGDDGKRRNPRQAKEREKAEQISSKRAASARAKGTDVPELCSPMSTPPVTTTQVTDHSSQLTRDLRVKPVGSGSSAPREPEPVIGPMGRLVARLQPERPV